DGIKIPPYRAIQLFTCHGETILDPARRLRLYLGATTVDEPLWRNDRPILLIDPKGTEVSMEAATPEARRLVPKKFLKRKGAV
ncbi:MAG: hypothetical protein HYY44_09510, partial [Deltaproteobacteria bacterium]|nr:hypothetical protein [Deltaproteobacteria bacterium]